MKYRKLPHQFYKVKTNTCQLPPNGSSAELITNQPTTTLIPSPPKRVKPTHLLVKLNNLPMRVLGCGLVIGVGLMVAMTQPADAQSLATPAKVSALDEFITTTGALLLLMVVMVVYKKINGIKV